VAPTGDDAAAVLDGGVTPLRNVASAIAYADHNRGGPCVVCVAAGVACGLTFSYAGPAGAALEMRDGISVWGGYESATWTRCATTALAPTTAVGISFGSDIGTTTTLDGFDVVRAAVAGSAAVTLQGASGAVLSSLVLTGEDPDQPDWVGVFAGNSEVTISSLETDLFTPGSDRIIATGSAVGVLGIGSRVTLSDSLIGLRADDGSAVAVALSGGSGSSILDTEIDVSSGGLVATSVEGIRLEDDTDTLVSGATLTVRATEELTTDAIGILSLGSDGLVIEASAVSVKGEALSELVSALGIRLSGCAGAVSEVRQNSLIEARAILPNSSSSPRGRASYPHPARCCSGGHCRLSIVRWCCSPGRGRRSA
jgi:hypothetical protein